MSRRFQRRHRQIGPTAEAHAWLTEDYPEQVKAAIYLASRGALRGLRTCLFCGRTGTTTKMKVPVQALRAVDPDTSGIQAYWVCQVHAKETPDDDTVRAALAARRQAGRR